MCEIFLIIFRKKRKLNVSEPVPEFMRSKSSEFLVMAIVLIELHSVSWCNSEFRARKGFFIVC